MNSGVKALTGAFTGTARRNLSSISTTARPFMLRILSIALIASARVRAPCESKLKAISGRFCGRRITRPDSISSRLSTWSVVSPASRTWGTSSSGLRFSAGRICPSETTGHRATRVSARSARLIYVEIFISEKGKELQGFEFKRRECECRIVFGGTAAIYGDAH